MQRSLPLGLVIVILGCAYALHLSSLWERHEGLLLTSADDASRLLLAYSWGRYEVFPLHWTWPPLPMLIDGLFVRAGGDVIVWGSIARAVILGATGVLLAIFWQRAFARKTTLPESFALVVLLWLFFPINVHLAVSGLSEPYLYFLLAMGLTCWQQALARGGSAGADAAWTPTSFAWMLCAAFTFGVSVWARYEGAVAISLFSLWLLFARILSRRGEGASCARILPDVVLLAVVVAPALLWLCFQYVELGDPLYFVKATRDVVRREALQVHGTERMPLSRMLATLRTSLWSWPVVLCATVGFVRLVFENRAVARLAGGFVLLYALLIAVSVGGRMQYYFNLFSLLVLPLAVKGLEWLAVFVGRRITSETRGAAC